MKWSRRRKLSRGEAIKLIEEINANPSNKELILQRYGINRVSLWAYATRTGYKVRRKPDAQVTDEIAREIRERAQEGTSSLYLMLHYDINQPTLHNILTGKIHKQAGGPIRPVLYESKRKGKHYKKPQP